MEEGLQGPVEDIRGWRAVRVDLVSPPVDRYAFALLGWTGSRVRNLISTLETNVDLDRCMCQYLRGKSQVKVQFYLPSLAGIRTLQGRRPAVTTS